MTRLEEIQTAIDRQALLLFLVQRMRSEGDELPEPRRFSANETNAWIAEDEADKRRLRSKSLRDN